MNTDASTHGAGECTMTEPYSTYLRTRHFLAPEIRMRYFRIFGDLEYDRAAIRTEVAVLELTLREISRRIDRQVAITIHDERTISTTSHALSTPLYRGLERLHADIASALSFHYSHEHEGHARMLLTDIANGVLGIADACTRESELWRLNDAEAAYAALDIPRLVDIHDLVQTLLAHPRRDNLDDKEIACWRSMTAAILAAHPISHTAVLATPEHIDRHRSRLLRRIESLANRLEIVGLAYTCVVAHSRLPN